MVERGSCTDHAASATVIVNDNAISATPPDSQRCRRSGRRSAPAKADAAVDRRHGLSILSMIFPKPVHFRSCSSYTHEAMQRLGRGFLVVNKRDADVSRSGIAAIGAVAREIMTGDDAQAAFPPKLFAHRLVAALRADVEPEEKAAGRPDNQRSPTLLGEVELATEPGCSRATVAVV
jgi:hypothetical protein